VIEEELRSYYGAIELSVVDELRLVEHALHADVKRRAPFGAVIAAVVLILAAVSVVAAVTLSRNHAQPARHGGTGIVTGQAPVCYGPGPDDNLHPHITIHAVAIKSGQSRSVTFRNSDRYHTYRIRLEAGTYRLHAQHDAAITVTVQAGATLRHADLPIEACT
jgi:hypothetical protein